MIVDIIIVIVVVAVLSAIIYFNFISKHRSPCSGCPSRKTCSSAKIKGKSCCDKRSSSDNNDRLSDNQDCDDIEDISDEQNVEVVDTSSEINNDISKEVVVKGDFQCGQNCSECKQKCAYVSEPKNKKE